MNGSTGLVGDQVDGSCWLRLCEGFPSVPWLMSFWDVALLVFCGVLFFSLTLTTLHCEIVTPFHGCCTFVSAQPVFLWISVVCVPSTSLDPMWTPPDGEGSSSSSSMSLDVLGECNVWNPLLEMVADPVSGPVLEDMVPDAEWGWMALIATSPSTSSVIRCLPYLSAARHRSLLIVPCRFFRESGAGRLAACLCGARSSLAPQRRSRRPFLCIVALSPVKSEPPSCGGAPDISRRRPVVFPCRPLQPQSRRCCWRI